MIWNAVPLPMWYIWRERNTCMSEGHDLSTFNLKLLLIRMLYVWIAAIFFFKCWIFKSCKTLDAIFLVLLLYTFGVQGWHTFLAKSNTYQKQYKSGYQKEIMMLVKNSFKLHHLVSSSQHYSYHLIGKTKGHTIDTYMLHLSVWQPIKRGAF